MVAVGGDSSRYVSCPLPPTDIMAIYRSVLIILLLPCCLWSILADGSGVGRQCPKIISKFHATQKYYLI